MCEWPSQRVGKGQACCAYVLFFCILLATLLVSKAAPTLYASAIFHHGGVFW